MLASSLRYAGAYRSPWPLAATLVQALARLQKGVHLVLNGLVRRLQTSRAELAGQSMWEQWSDGHYLVGPESRKIDSASLTGHDTWARMHCNDLALGPPAAAFGCLPTLDGLLAGLQPSPCSLCKRSTSTISSNLSSSHLSSPPHRLIFDAHLHQHVLTSAMAKECRSIVVLA